MLSHRRIPTLQILNRRLVKTVQFKNPNYIGDPLNAIKIFNDKEVDELAIIDISPDNRNTGPDIEFLETLLSECRMPVSYGGHIRSFKDAKHVIRAGVEKIIINTLAFENPEQAAEISNVFGRQALSLSLDYKMGFLKNHVFFKHGGKTKARLKEQDITALSEQINCGEIILHSIQNDGLFCGLDYSLFERLKDQTSLPIILCGGARNKNDMLDAFEKGVHSVAAGSMFVYQGPLKGVLIQYE